MNIGLIGYGKMGKMIEALAISRGHKITLIVDPFVSGSGAQCVIAPSLPVSASDSDAASTEVIIEFTKPETAADNIKAAIALGKPVVCGSTGWYAQLPDISAAAEKAGTALLWSSNFSLGVNLFYRIAEYAAKLTDPFAEYDLGGTEIHHNKKADSPSGTAKTLMERVLKVMKRKTKVLWNAPDKENPLTADTAHFSSLRYGSVPGTHSLFFDSPADTIEITHTARNREGFASGVCVAAEWLTRQNRKGIFTMEDVLKDMLP